MFLDIAPNGNPFPSSSDFPHLPLKSDLVNPGKHKKNGISQEKWGPSSSST